MGLDFGVPSEAPNVQRFFNVNTIVDMCEISAILMKSWWMENSGVKSVSSLAVGATSYASDVRLV